MEFRISSPPVDSETPKRRGFLPGPAALGASLALHGILAGGILLVLFAPSPEPLPPVIVTAELVDSAAIAPTVAKTEAPEPETVPESAPAQPAAPQKPIKATPAPPQAAPAAEIAAPLPLPPEPKRKPEPPDREAEPPEFSERAPAAQTDNDDGNIIARLPAAAEPTPATGSVTTPQSAPVATRTKYPPALAGINGNQPPRYPLSARRRGIEGRVILAVSVGRDGIVATIRVKQSSGAEILDRAALTAVRDWRFKPATIAGVSVAGRIDVPITFRLK